MPFSKRWNPSSVLYYWHKLHLVFGSIFIILCIAEALCLRFISTNKLIYNIINITANMFCLLFAIYQVIAVKKLYLCTKKLEFRKMTRYMIALVIVNSFSQFCVSAFYNVMEIISMIDSNVLHMDGEQWFQLKMIKDDIFCVGLIAQSVLMIAM